MLLKPTCPEICCVAVHDIPKLDEKYSNEKEYSFHHDCKFQACSD